MKPTFNDFLFSRTRVADLRVVCPDEFNNVPEPVPGYVYNPTEAAFPKWLMILSDGRYDAGDMIGRFNNLSDAEKALYEWEG